jgi:hypothetical protein
MYYHISLHADVGSTHSAMSNVKIVVAGMQDFEVPCRGGKIAPTPA